MLVLTRKVRETVVIDDDIRLTVLDVSGYVAKLLVVTPERKYQISLRKEDTCAIAVDVKITLIKIQTDKIRLGITAPQKRKVHREEVWLNIQSQKVIS